MSTLLVKNIHTLVTMDALRREIRDAALLVRDNVILQVGSGRESPATADEVF
jgi:cytosine/adenosine deaminase-related metal-dependent hydrolase